MSIAISKSGDLPILSPTDSALAGFDRAELRNLIEEQIELGCKNVILDLTSLRNISSTGLGVVVACYVALRRAGGSLHLVGVTGRVLHCIKITGLFDVFECFDTLGQALVYIRNNNEKSREEK